MAEDRRMQRCPVCNLDVDDVTVTMLTAAGRKFKKFKYLNSLDVVGPVCNIDFRWAGSRLIQIFKLAGCGRPGM
jgi:hypothetical protein